MAKLSSINKNNRRIKLANKFYQKRKKLKKIIMDKKLPLEQKKPWEFECNICKKYSFIFRFFEIKLYNTTHGNYSDEKNISR